MRHTLFSAFSRGSCLTGCTALLCFVQCVSEHEILGDADAGSGAQTSACYEALARGTDGDPCTGSFSCSTGPRPCCVWTAVCNDGSLTITEDCASCACEGDADCAEGSWCVAGRCAPCATLGDCVFPDIVVPRNGCSWCVPLGECGSDEECYPGTICYAGQACPPGCASPSCCFGNLCDAPGCAATDELDCGLVGCADSLRCDVVGARPDCSCTSGRWTCSTDSTSACVAP